MLKRKVLIILVLIVSCFLFSNISYGSNNGTVYLTSKQDKVNQGEEIEITVNLQNNKIAACNFYIYFEGENVEYISEIKREDDIENINLSKNELSFVWFDRFGGEKPKEGEIATFKFRAKENGFVTFTVEGEFYNQKGQLIETNFKEVNVQIGEDESNFQKQVDEEQGTSFENTNCDLQVLRVDREGLTPNFDKGIQEYYLMVPENVQNLEVFAVSENPNSVVEVKGNTNLQKGINDVMVKVISPDQTQNKVYLVHVSKSDNFESANTNLEVLAIENVLLNPPFDNLHTNYEIEVSNETDSINIFAVPENEQASVEIVGKDNLKEGENSVTVQVKAKDGFTTKNYRIKVNKRSLDEEKKYQENKEKQKGDLENAYKIEKTSATINGSNEQLSKIQNKSYMNVVVWVVGVLVILLVIFVIIWKKQRSNKTNI